MILRVLLLFSCSCCVCVGTFEVNVAQNFYQGEENGDITLEFRFTTKDNTFFEIFIEKSNEPWAKPVLYHGGEKVPLSQDEQFADQVQCDKNVLKEKSTDQRAKVLFHQCKGEEVPESQDEQFAGRVQFDEAVLRKGKVRLHLSRLRIEDSGLYTVEVMTRAGLREVRFFLSVTAARNQSEPERTNTARDQPETERPNTARDQSEPERPNTARDQSEPERPNTAKDQSEPERPNTASQGRIALYWTLGVAAATAVLLVVCGNCNRQFEVNRVKANEDQASTIEPLKIAKEHQQREKVVQTPPTTAAELSCFQVIVHGIRGEVVAINLCNTEVESRSITVRQLKEKIAQKLPDIAGLGNVGFIYIDKRLDNDSSSLSGYGIKHMSVIYTVIKLPGAGGPPQPKGDGGMGDKDDKHRKSVKKIQGM